VDRRSNKSKKVEKKKKPSPKGYYQGRLGGREKSGEGDVSGQLYGETTNSPVTGI